MHDMIDWDDEEESLYQADYEADDEASIKESKEQSNISPSSLSAIPEEEFSPPFPSRIGSNSIFKELDENDNFNPPFPAYKATNTVVRSFLASN